jgi:CYTH domain-containing protein
MKEIELEKTYLLKYKPEGLDGCASVEIFDVYFPKSMEHPSLRLRKKGDKFEMTKKFPINEKDSSEQEEHTISLTKDEYNALRQADGKEVRKIRHYYQLSAGLMAEVDIFKDKLEGLGLVDVEFKTKEEKDKFLAPDFCLAEVSQDKWLAGGMLAGGEISGLEELFKKYNYKKI